MLAITQLTYNAVITKSLKGIRPALNQVEHVPISVGEVESYSNVLVRSMLIRMHEAEHQNDLHEVKHLLSTVIAFVRYNIPQFVDIWRTFTEHDWVEGSEIDDEYVLDTMIALYETRENDQKRYLNFRSQGDLERFMQIASNYDGELSRDLAEMGIDVAFFQKKYNVETDVRLCQ